MNSSIIFVNYILFSKTLNWRIWIESSEVRIDGCTWFRIRVEEKGQKG